MHVCYCCSLLLLRDVVGGLGGWAAPKPSAPLWERAALVALGCGVGGWTGRGKSWNEMEDDKSDTLPCLGGRVALGVCCGRARQYTQANEPWARTSSESAQRRGAKRTNALSSHARVPPPTTPTHSTLDAQLPSVKGPMAHNNNDDKRALLALDVEEEEEEEEEEETTLPPAASHQGQRGGPNATAAAAQDTTHPILQGHHKAQQQQQHDSNDPPPVSITVRPPTHPSSSRDPPRVPDLDRSTHPTPSHPPR